MVYAGDVLYFWLLQTRRARAARAAADPERTRLQQLVAYRRGLAARQYACKTLWRLASRIFDDWATWSLGLRARRQVLGQLAARYWGARYWGDQASANRCVFAWASVRRLL